MMLGRAVIFAAMGIGVAGCTQHLVLPSGDPVDGSVGASDAPTERSRHDGGSGGVSGTSCTFSTVQSDPLTANMMLVVGRDASMGTRFGDATRMAAVQSTLLGVVAANQTAVSFGYAEFPSFDNCPNGGVCCLGSNLAVAPSPFTGGVQLQLGMCGSGPVSGGCTSVADSRPLPAVLDSANAVFSNVHDKAIDRYVVLFVDGGPTCSNQGPPMNACKDAAADVTNLANNNVKTFVVAIGDEAANDQCLRMMAALGGAPQGSIFSATDPFQLSKIVDEIVSGAAASACTIVLRQVVPDPAKVQVFLIDQQIPFDPTGQNGWEFGNGTTRIRINGDWCGMVQSQPANAVMVTSGCAPCGGNISCR